MCLVLLNPNLKSSRPRKRGDVGLAIIGVSRSAGGGGRLILSHRFQQTKAIQRNID
jgi:hypothetical protein